MLAAALVPLFVLMPTLVKTTDVKLATVQAVRYGAWEQTIRAEAKGGAVLADEMNRRFYAEPDTAIRTDQGNNNAQNLFWTGAGLDGPLVNTAENDTLSVEDIDSNVGGIAGTVGFVVSTLGETLGLLVSDSEWGLGANGIHTVNIELNVENAAQISEGLQGQDCQGGIDQVSRCMRTRSAILVDTWGASGPDQVTSRVRSLVPTGVLEPVGDALALIGEALPLFQELEGLEGAFGEVKPDVLPPDRYGDEEE